MWYHIVRADTIRSDNRSITMISVDGLEGGWSPDEALEDGYEIDKTEKIRYSTALSFIQGPHQGTLVLLMAMIVSHGPFLTYKLKAADAYLSFE